MRVRHTNLNGLKEEVEKDPKIGSDRKTSLQRNGVINTLSRASSTNDIHSSSYYYCQTSYVDVPLDRVCLIDDSARYYLRCASTHEEAVSTFLPSSLTLSNNRNLPARLTLAMEIRVESKPERISNLRDPILANEDVFVTSEGVFRNGGIDAVFRPSKGEVKRASFNEEMQGEILLVVSVLLNCRVNNVNIHYVLLL